MVRELGDRGANSVGDPRGALWDSDAVQRRWAGRNSRFAGDGVTRKLLGLCRKYVRGAVLDVGAGAGGPMKLLPHAVGLDLAPRQPGTVRGDMCAMPFKTGAFDTVFSIEVLEHLPGERLTHGLREVRRVLRPGGHAILVTPDREDLTRRETVCPQCGTVFHWLGHVRAFDETALTAILHSVGLEAVMVRALHLGFEGRHRLAGRFSFLLPRLGFQEPKSLVAVARRPA